MESQLDLIESEVDRVLDIMEKACNRFGVSGGDCRVAAAPGTNLRGRKEMAKHMIPTSEMQKISVVAPLNTEVATLAQVAEALELPPESSRQPDLQYLTAIFVSSGQNKNGAVFLGSELVKARGSIDSKAVDLEHEERTVIGQITGSVFLNRDRTPLDAELAATKLSTEQLDELKMDIGIAAIIHKARFPEIAEEIAEGQWMVSMEAYYRDYDIKVGDMIIPKDEAVDKGLDKLVGSVVHLTDGDKEMGFHLVGRVLRDILFAGVGIVKNPANPRSIIMEAAAVDDYVEEKRKEGKVETINLADVSTIKAAAAAVKNEGVSSVATDTTAPPEDLSEFVRECVIDEVAKALSERDPGKEEANDINHIRPGTCVSYKRYIYEYPDPALSDRSTDDFTQDPILNPPGPVGVESPGAEITREHWCALFDLDCAARPGDATLPTCWRNVFARTVREEVDTHEEVLRRRRVQVGLVALQDLIDDSKKFRQ